MICTLYKSQINAASASRGSENKNKKPASQPLTTSAFIALRAEGENVRRSPGSEPADGGLQRGSA